MALHGLYGYEKAKLCDQSGESGDAVYFPTRGEERMRDQRPETFGGRWCETEQSKAESLPYIPLGVPPADEVGGHGRGVNGWQSRAETVRCIPTRGLK